MQPLPPTSFPRRVKRFQSLSMTPFDCQVDIDRDFQNVPSISSNKTNLYGSNKTFEQLPDASGTNPVTNQFSFKNRKKLFDTGNFILKNSLKAQLGSTNKQPNSSEKNNHFSNHKTHRKMISSEIFDTSSINIKFYYSDEKTNQNSTLIFRNGERTRTQLHKFKNSFGQNDKKNREMHVPSFLLNKKRTPRESQVSACSQTIPREMYESTPLSKYQQRNDERRGSFKKEINLNSLKSIENQSQQEIFSPPSNEKIAYSKATSSTICTNLPRQESRRTFKDFDEMEELKEMSNSMEESDNNSHSLQNEFENLFKKEESPCRHTVNLENEIAQLFSDEEAESEQFDEGLQNQLEQLF